MKRVWVTTHEIDMYAKYWERPEHMTQSELRQLVQTTYRVYSQTGQYGKFLSDLVAVVGDDSLRGA